jgi:hypothetical protein
MPRIASALLTVATGCIVASCDAVLSPYSCNETKRWDTRLDASVARQLLVTADVGDLEIIGRSGLRDVRVTAHACARTVDDLAAIELVTSSGSETVNVRGRVPATVSRGRAKLDLTIEVPDDMAIDVDHGTGWVSVDRTGPAIIRQRSGDVIVSDVLGNLSFFGGSGSLDASTISGDVRVEHGSGDVTLTDVRGFVDLVLLRTGTFIARDVLYDVVVHQLDVGDIIAERIGGALVVLRHGSGQVQFRDVRGGVTLPP